MKRIRGGQAILAFVVAIAIALGGAPPAVAAPKAVAPVLGDIVRRFDPPDQPWLAGHRGVDIEGTAGQVVVAAMDGTVSFAGMVAGRPVITLQHDGGLSTTYEPVEAAVGAGQRVAAGQPIGTLVAGHACPLQACLHWGLRDGSTYLDPLSLLGAGHIRLISDKEMQEIRDRAARLAQLTAGGKVSASGLVSPVTGEVSSPYGWRVHPIDGVTRFHDGLDIAAACGSPIVAAASGVVTESSSNTGYGNRLVVDHGTVAGHQLRTSYNHAESYVVSVGDRVEQGQLIGWVGSTGASTGCHLHFQTWVDGQLTDPEGLLP